MLILKVKYAIPHIVSLQPQLDLKMIIVSISGITLQALWVRLENRPNFKMKLDEGSQEFLWRCILSIPDLEFYRLPSPRGVLNPKLPIVIDPESGVTVDFVS